MNADALDALYKALGKEKVITNIEDRICYSHDATSMGVALPPRQKAIADVVIKASSTEEVSAVIKVADKYTIPVYPCGARSGLSGGSVPLYGGIVLDTTRMNRILEINPQDLMATVEPGVVNKRFQDEVAKYKLYYPPFPGSAEFSTLGGNVAECSGGMAGLKYGVTRDYVLSLEVVLPDGSVINTGRRTLRSVAGYDLTRLFVGSEGTLGVFTKITVKLIPLPEKVETLLAYFKDPEEAADAADAIILGQRVIPKTLEFVDSICINSIRGYGGVEIPQEAKAFLLIDVDGKESEVGKDLAAVERACKENGAFEIIVAKTAKESEALCAVRKSISPALFKVAGRKLNEDICVPRSKIKEILRELYSIGERYSLATACFGHIGDGNVHVNFLYGFEEEDEKKVGEMVRHMLKKVVSVGGTITGEHGVGIAKAEFLPLEVPPQELQFMKSLKNFLDPKGIMNPGKIFI
ncbi:MAG TPA: FAD-binding oxidoreductase [Candidatus Hypogeohydataceae bacterium YC40]